MTKSSHTPSPEARRWLATLSTSNLWQAQAYALTELALDPDNPSANWLMGRCYALQNRHDEAAEVLSKADQSIEDFALKLPLSSALWLSGKPAESRQTLMLALPLCQSAAQYFQLSIEAERQSLSELALQCANQAIARDPKPIQYPLQKARILQSFGEADAAERCLRAVIAKAGNSVDWLARAWFALSDLKTIALSSSDIAQINSVLKRTTQTETRKLLYFALGSACESAGRYADAVDALHQANAIAAAQFPWSGNSFEAQIRESMSEGFSPGRRGSELIFIVGLPRSGTSLVEQILCAHPNIEGAGELPFLPMLIESENHATGRRYGEWLHSHGEARWAALAERYLAQTAHFRAQKPISTDKLPENWHYLGAIRRMFPGAKIVACSRDPFETAWSCYKQLFAPGRVTFSYDLNHLAHYTRIFQAATKRWQTLDENFYRCDFEALASQPEPSIRALLSSLQLDFADACLQPHLHKRSLNTPSASQVKRPIAKPNARLNRYGDALEFARVTFDAVLENLAKF